jgi:hypothetical protein
MISDEEFERAFHAARDALTNKNTKIFRQVKRGQLDRIKVQAALARLSRSRARELLTEIDGRWKRNCELQYDFQKRRFGEILREVLNFKHIYNIYDREAYKAFIGFCKIGKLLEAVSRQDSEAEAKTPSSSVVFQKPQQPVHVSINAKTGQQGWDF